MKKILLLICVFAISIANAQDFEQMTREQRAKDSIAQLSQGNPSDSYNVPGSYLTRFIGYDYNKAMPGLQMFLQHKMSMASVDAMSGMEKGWLKIAYTPQIDDSKVQRLIYVLTRMDNKGLIQQMKITGNWSLLVPLFCDYWPTKLNFNNLKKGEVVSVYNLNEKITLSSNLSDGSSIITIAKVSGK